MKRTGIWLSLLAVAPMVLQAQNLLINGSFEEPSMAGAGDLYSSQPGFGLPGWTYPPEPMRFFLEYGQPLGLPRFADGRQAVCLNGEGSPVSIAQTFATTPGQNYILSYAVAYPIGPGPTSSLVASVARLSRSFVPSGGTNYVLQSWQFTAPSNSATVAFTDSHLLGSAPTFLDAVSVLPGSALLAGMDTPIPGGTGMFTAFPSEPCLSRGNAVSLGQGNGGQQGIYVQWPPEPMKVVADLNTAIPGGSFGNFTSFWPSDPMHPPVPCISGSNVVFYGAGAGVQGVYGLWPPQPMKVIADTTTAIPGGTGNFIGFTQVAYPPDPLWPPCPTISGNNVAFWGAGSGGQQGIYVQHPGEPIKVIADTTTAIPNGTGTFIGFPPGPMISGESVVFVGSGSGGQQGVYVQYPGVYIQEVSLGGLEILKGELAKQQTNIPAPKEIRTAHKTRECLRLERSQNRVRLSIRNLLENRTRTSGTQSKSASPALRIHPLQGSHAISGAAHGAAE